MEVLPQGPCPTKRYCLKPYTPEAVPIETLYPGNNSEKKNFPTQRYYLKPCTPETDPKKPYRVQKKQSAIYEAFVCLSSVFLETYSPSSHSILPIEHVWTATASVTYLEYAIMLAAHVVLPTGVAAQTVLWPSGLAWVHWIRNHCASIIAQTSHLGSQEVSLYNTTHCSLRAIQSHTHHRIRCTGTTHLLLHNCQARILKRPIPGLAGGRQFRPKHLPRLYENPANQSSLLAESRRPSNNQQTLPVIIIGLMIRS